jgi:hypothetical protein
MVQTALQRPEQEGVVETDENRKAAMASSPLIAAQ